MSAPIRLLWLIDKLERGGAQSLFIPFARGLDRARYRLTVVSLAAPVPGGVDDALRAEGVEPVYLGARNLRDRAAFRRLVALIRDERIDLIHAHLGYAGMWSALITRRTHIPSVTTLHVGPYALREQRSSIVYKLATDARDWLLRRILGRWSTRVLMVSGALRDTYVRLGGLDPARVDVVHNGIDVARFRRDRAACRALITEQCGVPPGAPVAATVAVLRPAKGIEVLLEAIRDVPDAWFVIIGDGPSRAELEQLAGRLGVAGRVRWAGFRTDIDTILAGFDLFVHPSLDDAFPTVLLESLAAGVPVLASRVGGIPEIVTPGETGELVPAGDARALAAAASRVLGEGSSLDRMRSAAIADASRRFSVEAWLGRLDAVYADVLRSPSAHLAHSGSA